MGSKMGISDKLIPFLQKIIDENGIVEYWEPFVGGANVIDKIRCGRRVGVDKMYHLIALLEKARDDIKDIPKSCSKEEFDLARDIYRGKSHDEMEAWRLGAYAYLGSYSGKGFIGSYCVDKKTGRDIYGERLKNLATQAPSLVGIDFKSCDYRDLEIPDGVLIYCDPSYFGTTEYQYASEGKFDHKVFGIGPKKFLKDALL